jgi:hypothetical protein
MLYLSRLYGFPCLSCKEELPLDTQLAHERTAGRADLLITSDEHGPHEAAIREAYAIERSRPKPPGPGWPPKPVGSEEIAFEM